MTGSLDLLATELAAVDAGDEYAIFGSASLRLRGIIDRSCGDIDVMVTRRVWGALLARDRWVVETPNAGDPPILTLVTPVPLHLFFAWDDIALWMDPAAVIAGGELVRGFRCAALGEVLRHKREAVAWVDRFPAVAKHRPDIEAIEAHLAGRAVQA